jgi:hypothetical protein
LLISWFSQAAVRSHLKERGILPDADNHQFPNQVDPLVLSAFDLDSEQPSIQGIRVDWTWRNKAYNICVFNLLAADFLELVKAGRFDELNEVTLGKLAGKCDPLVYVFEKTMQAARRQKKTILCQHQLHLASADQQQYKQRCGIDEVEEERALRRAGRRTGVSPLTYHGFC